MQGLLKYPIVREARKSRPRFPYSIWDRDYRFDTLPGEIDLFLDQGLSDAELTVQEVNTKYSVCFQKYFGPSGSWGLRLIFRWPSDTESQLENVKKVCQETGFEVEVIPNGRVDQAKGIEFDCGDDAERAFLGLITILAVALGLPPESRFVLDKLNVSPWVEIIDDPEQAPASNDARFQAYDEWLKRKCGYGVLSSTAMGVAGIFQIIGILVLLVTLLFQGQGWPGISIGILELEFMIPWSGLISFLFLIIGFMGLFSEMYWRTPGIGGGLIPDPVPKSLRGFIRVFFGRPVNWVTMVLLLIAFYSWSSL